MTKRIGIIGCGNIAPAYIKGCALFPDDVQVVACADIDLARAEAFAAQHAIQALTPEALLKSDDVDIVINLTIPAVHAEVSLQAIAAGKHVHSEKPLAITIEDGRRVLEAAAAANVRVGCAPDTFLGGGLQTARQLIDRGAIGRPIAATAFMMSHGPEKWHPNPGFFYEAGGGPMLDMGPYYITALVHLLGPIRRVQAATGRAFEERVAGHEAIKGQKLPVQISTHAAGTLDFESGAIATMIMSFDVWQHNLPRIEIYGTEGSLSVPDPNTFNGVVRLWQPASGNWQDMPPTHRDDVLRGIGVVDMARAIAENTPHRASGQLAYHVLETMMAFDTASEQGRAVLLSSGTDQPAPLPPI